MDTIVAIELPRHLLNAASITPEELKLELAVHLYETRRLSIGHAREMAGLSLWEFRQILASRKISPHYDVSDLDEDMQTWAELDAE
jgi:predicted HTH domain antitoxin